MNELKEKVEMALNATNSNDVYSIGMRNAFRWVLCCITGEEPVYEDCHEIDLDYADSLKHLNVR